MESRSEANEGKVVNDVLCAPQTRMTIATQSAHVTEPGATPTATQSTPASQPIKKMKSMDKEKKEKTVEKAPQHCASRHSARVRSSPPRPPPTRLPASSTLPCRDRRSGVPQCKGFYQQRERRQHRGWSGAGATKADHRGRAVVDEARLACVDGGHEELILSVEHDEGQ